MTKQFYKVYFLAFLGLIGGSVKSMQNFCLSQDQKANIRDSLRTGNFQAAHEQLLKTTELSQSDLDQIGKEAANAGCVEVLENCLDFIAKDAKENLLNEFMAEAINAEKINVIKMLLAKGADRIQAKQRAEQATNPNQAIIKVIKDHFSFSDYCFNNHYLLFLGGLALLELLIVKGYLIYTDHSLRT